MAVDASVQESDSQASAHGPDSPSLPPPPYSLCNAFSPKLGARRPPSIVGAYSLPIDDFAGGIRLLQDLINALQEHAAPSEEYRQLVADLQSLEIALFRVNDQYGEIESPTQRIVLDQAGQACRKSLNDFLKSIGKYQHSGSTRLPHVIENPFRKVQWALVDTEELAAFRSRISAHVQSIQTLLVTIQVSLTQNNQVSMRRYDDSRDIQDDRTSSMDYSVELINTSFDNLRQQLVDQGPVAEKTLASVDAIKQIMITNNLMLLGAIKQLQNSLPPQVLLQKPVIFLDAINRVAPIHLEWINSWDAFLAVLAIRFKHLGHNKVKRREFVIQESSTRRLIAFSKPLETCISPGQKLDMSMIFQEQSDADSLNDCPHCHKPSSSSNEEEVECQNCGCHFHRIQQVNETPTNLLSLDSTNALVLDSGAKASRKRRSLSNAESDDDVQPSDFKRLQMIRLRTVPERNRKRQRRKQPEQVQLPGSTLSLSASVDERPSILNQTLSYLDDFNDTESRWEWSPESTSFLGNDDFLPLSQNSNGFRTLPLSAFVESANNQTSEGETDDAKPAFPITDWFSDELGLLPAYSSGNLEFESSDYLPKLEATFMRDFSCCGLTLPSLHDLLQHYEEAHLQRAEDGQQKTQAQQYHTPDYGAALATQTAVPILQQAEQQNQQLARPQA